MRREIYALDYAVSAFLHHLDLLMTFGSLEGWFRLNGGLNLEVQQNFIPPGNVEEAYVFVRPVSWSEPCHIRLRLYRYGSPSWHMVDGAIYPPSFPTTALVFKVESEEGPTLVVADDRDSKEILGPVLERAARALRALM